MSCRRGCAAAHLRTTRLDVVRDLLSGLHVPAGEDHARAWRVKSELSESHEQVFLGWRLTVRATCTRCAVLSRCFSQRTAAAHLRSPVHEQFRHRCRCEQRRQSASQHRNEQTAAAAHSVLGMRAEASSRHLFPPVTTAVLPDKSTPCTTSSAVERLPKGGPILRLGWGAGAAATRYHRSNARNTTVFNVRYVSTCVTL